MISPTAPTSKPPAGESGRDAQADLLLHELQQGDRGAFERYHASYRAPVYDLLRRLLPDGDDVVSATDEVFTTAFRRIILQDGHIALRAWTYRSALDVCRERLAERETAGARAGGLEHPIGKPAARARRTVSGDLGRRFAQVLESMEFDYQAVLLLHDLDGLGGPELATVFAVTEDAAGGLLLRARETFRRAFEAQSALARTRNCRLAEQTAAGAVGRTVSDDEADRLQQHAGYCRHCRRTMADWREGPMGLALLLEEPALPAALETPPVFSTRAVATAAGVAGSSGLARALGRTGRLLKSKKAAYVLAAACLALSVGLAAERPTVERTLVVVSHAGIPWPTFPSKNVETPPADSATKATPDSSASAVASTATPQVVAEPASESTVTLVASFAGNESPSGADDRAVASLSRDRNTGTANDRTSASSQQGASGDGSTHIARSPDKHRERATRHHSHAGNLHADPGRARVGDRHSHSGKAHSGRHHKDSARQRHEGHAGKHSPEGQHQQGHAGRQHKAGGHGQGHAGKHHEHKNGKKDH
jgi:DNA-directed RNA polymerase specialized sigma24 family protein